MLNTLYTLLNTLYRHFPFDLTSNFTFLLVYAALSIATLKVAGAAGSSVIKILDSMSPRPVSPLFTSTSVPPPEGVKIVAWVRGGKKRLAEWIIGREIARGWLVHNNGTYSINRPDNDTTPPLTEFETYSDSDFKVEFEVKFKVHLDVAAFYVAEEVACDEEEKIRETLRKEHLLPHPAVRFLATVVFWVGALFLQAVGIVRLCWWVGTGHDGFVSLISVVCEVLLVLFVSMAMGNALTKEKHARLQTWANRIANEALACRNGVLAGQRHDPAEIELAIALDGAEVTRSIEAFIPFQTFFSDPLRAPRPSNTPTSSAK